MSVVIYVLAIPFDEIMDYEVICVRVMGMPRLAHFYSVLILAGIRVHGLHNLLERIEFVLEYLEGSWR